MFPQEEVQARIHVMQQEVLQRKVLMEEIKQWQGKNVVPDVVHDELLFKDEKITCKKKKINREI